MWSVLEGILMQFAMPICCPHNVVMYLTVHSYVFSGDIGNYYYGQGHPMKPHRIRMTHNLLLNYGLYRKMEIYVSVG